MAAHPNFDWKEVQFFPIQLSLQGIRCLFNPQTGEWTRADSAPEQDSPEILRLKEELNNLKVKNDILLDMITAKDLDMQEADKLVQELDEIIAKQG